MAGEQTFSKSLTTQEVNAIVEARVKAAIDKGSKRLIGPEIAEVQGWWNLWAMGPFQVPAPGGPLLPHKVIKVGEVFHVATVLWLNPNFFFPPGVSACKLLSNLACDFVIDYCTGDLCRWRRADTFSPTGIIKKMTPDQCYYVDIQTFTATPGTESCNYEMTICARITGCKDMGGLPPLAGWATAVYDFDEDTFYPTVPPQPPTPTPAPPPLIPPTPAPGQGPGWRFREPIRFMIYP